MDKLKLLNAVNIAVDEETEQSIKKYGYFHNKHEFYGVVTEELRELQHELNYINSLYEIIEKYTFADIRENERERAIKELFTSIPKLIYEAVQVRSICFKWKEYYGKEDKK